MKGLSSVFSSIFDMFNDPYKAGGNSLNNSMNNALGNYKPYYEAGTNALDRMKDPSAFLNQLMSQYQQSPFAKYQLDQSQKSATNAASENGLIGSTPMAQQIQQNAQGITSQDMESWLSKVLGMNTGMADYGMQSANSMGDIWKSFGPGMAQAQYGQATDTNAGVGDIFKFLFGG